MLGKTIKANVQSEKVNVINAALGKKEDRMIIRYPKQNTALASFHPYTQEVNEFYRIDDIISEEVDVLLLDKACEHFSLGSEFILKIDTQGHEVDVIQGGLKTIHRAAALVLECSFAPEYQSLEPSFFEASRLLAEINFYPIIFQRYGKKLSYYPFERDVIFVRKDLLRRIFFKNY
jgi:FkbM family methyltransferase